MIRSCIYAVFFFCISGLNAQDRLQLDDEIRAYIKANQNDVTPSVSEGTVGNGSLKHGKLVPYKGKNFIYFDRKSYLEGRAFLNDKVLTALLRTMDSLHYALPNRYFQIMECAHKEG